MRQLFCVMIEKMVLVEVSFFQFVTNSRNLCVKPLASVRRDVILDSNVYTHLHLC